MAATSAPFPDHFDTAYELEHELEMPLGRHELLAMVHSIKPDDMECIYIRQPKALGLGHAGVLCAQSRGGQRALCRVAGR